MATIPVFLFVFLLSLCGVELFRRWSLTREILDVPNERSSHHIPTPRGGGLVIVTVSLVSYAVYNNFVTQNFQLSYFGAASLIAFISWLDDLFSISFVWRFVIQCLAALLIVFFLGFFRVIYFPYFGQINLGIWGAILTFLWIVWLTNAYNFMDGIDGIAGLQAITAGLGWFFIGEIFGLADIGFYGGVLAFASLGFLARNWHPAKIFMGDVGSAFLGFTFAVLPFLEPKTISESEYVSVLPFIAILLIWFFVYDTILTFTQRLLKRKKVWEAHRSHLYQRLVIAGLSHTKVCSLYSILSILTVALTIVVLTVKNYWVILFTVILIESIGLLLFVKVKEKSKFLT